MMSPSLGSTPENPTQLDRRGSKDFPQGPPVARSFALSLSERWFDLAHGMLGAAYVKSVPSWQKHRSLPHGSTT
jgi:hypothetical protein